MALEDAALGELAHDFLREKGVPGHAPCDTYLIAATNGSGPKSSSSIAVVSESGKGCSEIVCEPEHAPALPGIGTISD